MPFLNTTYYRIKHTEIVEIHKTRCQSLSSRFNFKDAWYWYVEIDNCNSFTKELWLKVLPLSIIDLIKNKKVSLLVSNYLEGTLSVVKPLYKLLVLDFKLPEENLILLTGARDIKKEVDVVSLEFKKKHIHVIWGYDHEYIMHFFEKQNPRVLETKPTYLFSKKFININRRWRLHRPTFVSLLILNRLITYGHVSLVELPELDGTWEKNWDLMLSRHPSFAEDLICNKHSIINSTPLIADKVDLMKNIQWGEQNLKELYETSYFTVVSETAYYSPESRFLTEKTLTPVVHRHPFILLSRPFSLEILKERGYKTFYPFINEQYDIEIDDDKRMKLVLEETKRLCNLNGYELQKFVDGCREICNFNYKNLMQNIKPYVKLT